MKTITFSNAFLVHVQKTFSTVWVDQSSERKHERTEMLPSPVSLMTVALQHQSPSQLKGQDPKHLQGYRMNLCICAVTFLCDCTQKDEPCKSESGPSLWYISWVRRESFFLFLCGRRLTFICQSSIHKNISFMIASGTSLMQWQMAPTKSTI